MGSKRGEGLVPQGTGQNVPGRSARGRSVGEGRGDGKNARARIQRGRYESRWAYRVINYIILLLLRLSSKNVN